MPAGATVAALGFRLLRVLLPEREIAHNRNELFYILPLTYIFFYMTCKHLYHSKVDNRTFPCYYPGQELRVRLLSQGWLHVGSLSCPPCTELCQVTL